MMTPPLILLFLFHLSESVTLGVFPSSLGHHHADLDRQLRMLLGLEDGMGLGLRKRSEDEMDIIKSRIQLQPTAQKRDYALLMDKLFYTLKNKMEEEEEENGRHYKHRIDNNNNNVAPVDGSGLERRGTGNGKVYWRCYFNAVSCF